MSWWAEILITGAAMFKAVADTVDHHFDTSVFRRLNARFWDRDVSETKAKRIFNYKLDAWHLSLSAMIVSLLLAVIFHERKMWWGYELAIGGTWWNIVFNTFYNKILR